MGVLVIDGDEFESDRCSRYDSELDNHDGGVLEFDVSSD